MEAADPAPALPEPTEMKATIDALLKNCDRTSRIARRDLKKLARLVSAEFIGTLDMLTQAKDDSGNSLSRAEAALTYLATAAAKEVVLPPENYAYLILEMEDGKETGEMAVARGLAEDILCAVLVKKA